ncbi:MAG TPA: sensor histidine kinase [Pedococcus sp.]|nr:sensor histidine kinase [Pedococcus sp.]
MPSPWPSSAPRRRTGIPRGIRVLGVLVLALVQVGGSFGAAHAQPSSRALDALGVVLLLIAPVSLLVRRPPWLRPILAGAATATFLSLGYPFGPVFFGYALALILAVVSGRRLLAWAVAAAVLVATVETRFVGSSGVSWQGLGGMVAWTVVVLAAGELVRGRRDRAISYRQAMQERRRRQAGEERLRIAQELHDVVAHHLSLINVQAGVALHLADRKPEHIEPALRAIKDASKEALTELRSLIDLLRDEDSPAPRAPAPTLAALDDLVDRSGRAGIEVTKVVEGQVRPLPAAVELAAYRIVQEATTNVIRHARASRASIVLGYGADALSVSIDDDGRSAPDPANLESGNGLRGMHERAHALGGALMVTASPLGGLRVEATIPTRETR